VELADRSTSMRCSASVPLVAARRRLDGLVAGLGEECVGFISEVLDAEPPDLAGGCVAQPWGVEELLRSLVRTRATGSHAGGSDLTERPAAH
jgi:hypothetical protein